MTAFETLVEKGWEEEDIRNVALEHSDEAMSQLSDKGYDSNDILEVVSNHYGMPDIIGGFIDTQPEEEEQTTFQYMEETAKEFIADTGTVVSETVDIAADLVEPMYDFAGDLITNKVNQVKMSAMIARRPILGLTQWVGKTFGYEDEIIKDISVNEKNILKTAKEMGLSVDELKNQETLVEVMSAFLPVDRLMKLSKGINNPITKRVAEGMSVGAGEAVLAGATQSGKEAEAFSDKAQSAATVAGTIGLVAPVAFDKVILPVLGKAFNATDIASKWVKEIATGKADSASSYDFLLNKVGATKDDASTWNEAYSVAIGKDVDKFTPEDKIAALLNNSNNGSVLKKQAEYVGADNALARQAKTEEMFNEMVFKETKDGSLEVPSLQLKKYMEDSGSIYGEVEDILKTHYNSTIKINPKTIEGLEDTLTSSSMRADDIAVVKRIIGDLKEATTDGIPVDRLLNMKHDLNSINLKSTKKWKAGQVGKLIDGMVEKGIGEEGFSIWKEVNQRYAAKSLMESDNPVVKLLTEGYKGTTNFKVIAEEILKIRQGGGYQTFNQIKLSLGDKVASSLEKEIINIAFKEKDNAYKALNKLKDFDFSTTEGRGILGELNRLEGLVPDVAAKELINQTLGMPKGSSIGWSDDIIAKARYGIVGKVFNSITKRLPNRAAKEERVFQLVSDQLKKSEFKGKIDYVKDKEFQNAFNQQEKIFTDRIAELKKIGEKRTASENKELIETISAKKKIVEHSTFGLSPKASKNKKRQKATTSVSERLSPKPTIMHKAGEDTSRGNLGIKPTGKKTSDKLGGGNKEKLKKYLDDIANPKVNVDSKKTDDLYSSLKADSTTMYAATVAKEKAWNNAMASVSKMRNKKSTTPKDREDMIKAVKEYYRLIDDTI